MYHVILIMYSTEKNFDFFEVHTIQYRDLAEDIVFLIILRKS